jgi:tetratricopeptide (TPR) repeat protein
MSSARPSFPGPSPAPERGPARDALDAGRRHDVAGRLDAAAVSYRLAVELAEASVEPAVQVEALRRLAVVRHRQNASGPARELCTRSYREALVLGDPILVGAALNALAGFNFDAGYMAEARANYLAALEFARSSAPLLGRIEQNLGILDSVQGRHEDALAHYRHALEAFELAGDEAGCAIALHNLGLIGCRRGELQDAERALDRSAAIAARIGDVHLAALCELHRAEVLHARQDYDEASRRAETALLQFERLGYARGRAEALRVIGQVLRDTGRPVLAEERLRAAVSLAVEDGWVLGQAEASRELARLRQRAGLDREALSLLGEAHRLFRRLDARLEVEDVAQRMAELAA